MADDQRDLTGLFPDRESAERAYQGIVDRGHHRNDVNLVMSDDTRKRHFSTDSGQETEIDHIPAVNPKPPTQDR